MAGGNNNKIPITPQISFWKNGLFSVELDNIVLILNNSKNCRMRILIFFFFAELFLRLCFVRHQILCYSDRVWQHLLISWYMVWVKKYCIVSWYNWNKQGKKPNLKDTQVSVLQHSSNINKNLIDHWNYKTIIKSVESVLELGRASLFTSSMEKFLKGQILIDIL